MSNNNESKQDEEKKGNVDNKVESYRKMENELAQARLQIAKLQRELDINKKNQESSTESKSNQDEQFWARIWTLLNDRDNDTIKDLINNGELSVHDARPDGMRLLAQSARKGNADICQLAINLGADIDHVDSYGRTALQWSVRNAYFNAEQVIRFAQMGAIVGQTVKKTANQLNEERGILQNIIKNFTKHDVDDKFGEKIINIMKDIISSKEIFSPDLLNLAWYFDVTKPNRLPQQSSLYKCIRKTCKQVIAGNDIRDWFWLKNYMLPSTVWLKKGDIKEKEKNKEENKNDNDDATEIVTSGLYNELIEITQKQEEIELVKLEAIMNLNNTKDVLIKLSKFGSEYSEKYDLRQDRIPNGVKASYTKDELSRKAMPSPTFDLHGHYNYNEYLSRLVMAANMMDEDFQKDLEKLLGKQKGVRIEHDLLNAIYYRHGPVKTMERCLAKAQTDYFDEEYPTSAKIIDLNRCKIVCDTVDQLLETCQLVANQIKYGNAGCIVDIVRVKNTFKEYINDGVCYADIKFNVLIRGKNESLIGEIQFLLSDMNEFKKGSHRLYSITRTKDIFDTTWTCLPLLTNDETRTFIAGQNNDVKQLLNLMVVNNKKMKDILFIAHSQETILNTICCKGLFDSFQFLQSKADKKLFIDRLLLPHQYNETCVEITIWGNQIKILKQLFRENPELLQNVLSDFDKNIKTIFRWVYWLVTKPGNSMFTQPDINMLNYVLDLLKLNDDQWNKLLNYRCEREKEGAFANPVSHIKYHIEQLFVLAVKTQKTAIILNLLETRMNKNVFIDGLFINDFYNKNCIEQAIKDNKLEIIKYLFEKKQVINRINDNEKLFYRLIFMLCQYSNDQIFDYVFNQIFKVSDNVLFKFLNYKYVENGKYFSSEYDTIFTKNNLLIQAAISQNSSRLQKLLDLIKGKDGKNMIKYMTNNKDNKSCLYICIEKENIDLSKMIISSKYVTNKQSKIDLINGCKSIGESNENAKKIIQSLLAEC